MDSRTINESKAQLVRLATGTQLSVQELEVALKTARSDFDRSERALRILLCESEGKHNQALQEIAILKSELSRRTAGTAELQSELSVTRALLDQERKNGLEAFGLNQRLMTDRKLLVKQIETLRLTIVNLTRETNRVQLALEERQREVEFPPSFKKG